MDNIKQLHLGVVWEIRGGGSGSMTMTVVAFASGAVPLSVRYG